MHSYANEDDGTGHEGAEEEEAEEGEGGEEEDEEHPFDFPWPCDGPPGYGQSPISHYEGPSPFSEPETKAVSDFVLTRKKEIKV